MAFSVGIDLGTSSVKLTLIDDQGAVVGTAGCDYAPVCPQPGWKEIDPELWWNCTCTAMRELLAPINAADVVAVGVTGQMHTTVFVDGEGQSVRPALMWNDTRDPELAARVRTAYEEAGLGYLSRIVSTGSPAVNLAWLAENEPESFAHTERFLVGPDWIVFKLTGSAGTDLCEASTSSLFDLEACDWDARARAVLGLPAEIYPAVVAAGAIVGGVSAAAAKASGLPEGCLVVHGTGDNPAAAIPTGCLTRKVPVLSLGTSGVLMGTRPEPDLEARGKNILLSLDGVERMTLVQGVVQSCGSSYSWWTKDVLKLTSFDSADAGIDVSRLGEGDLIFYPHLTGEKTLYGDPTLRGAFLGLSTDVTQAQMTLAVMEGVAFGVRQLAEEMSFDLASAGGLQVIGGGSKSRVWMQVLADVLGVDTLQMRGQTGAGYGMALLALAVTAGGDGEETSLASRLDVLAGGAVSCAERFSPDAAAQARYDAKYERYLRIHDGLKEVYG